MTVQQKGRREILLVKKQLIRKKRDCIGKERRIEKYKNMNNEVEDTNNDNSTKNVTSGQSKKI